MIEKLKYLIFFLIITLFFGCSFDNKTGIWSGKEKERKRIADLERQQKDLLETVSVYSSENVFSEEVLASKKIKLSSPKKNNSWSMAGSNLQNSIGHIFLEGIKDNFLKKKIGKNKFKITKLISSPVTFQNNILFSDDVGNIFFINKKGKIIWKKNIYKKQYKKIYKILTYVIYKEIIYVTDNIGFLYSVDIENGNVLWIKNLDIPIKSNIKILDDKIFLINQDNRIFCLDIKDGNKIWDIRTVSSFIKSQNFLALAISKKGDLIVINSYGDLLKIATKTGRIFWSQNTTASLFAHDTDFFQSSDVVITDNNIIFSTVDSSYSFDLDNGYLNWEKKIGSTLLPVVDGDNVFVISNSGFLINLDRSSGEIIFSTNILKILKEKKRETKVTGFVLGSGKIYAVTYNGYIIVVSAKTGKAEYSKKLGDPISSNPIINNNSLYILTDNSRILGFN